MSYIIVLKKNKNDIWEGYRNDYFIIITDFSEHDILKHSFIDIFIIIEKEELINKIKYRVLNNFIYNRLIIIKIFLYLFLNIDIMIAFLTQKSITIIDIILFIIILNYWKFEVVYKINIFNKIIIILF